MVTIPKIAAEANRRVTVRRFTILALIGSTAVWAQAPAAINPDAYLAHVKYLASPELKGRATGSPELENAASYIASQFQSFGVKPVPGSTYEQAFTTTVGARMGATNRLEAPTAADHRSAPARRLYPLQLFFLRNGFGAGGVRGIRNHRQRISLRRLCGRST